MDQELHETNPAPAEPAPAAAPKAQASPEAPAAAETGATGPAEPRAEASAPTIANTATPTEPEGQGALQQAFWRVLEEEKRNLPQHLLPLLEKLPKAEQLAYLLEHRQPLGLFGNAANADAAQPGDAGAWQSQPPAPAAQHAARFATRRALYQNF